MNHRTVVSPSRRYVAVCNKPKVDGHYFRTFTLPEEHENNSAKASWYFLNFMNFSACIEGCITEEDFKDVQEETSMAEAAAAEAA